MQTRIEEFQAAGAQVIAMSSSSVDNHARLAQKIGARFPILSDPEGVAIRAYGLLHPDALPYTGVQVARPAVFILDRERVARKRFLTDNWRVRVRPERLLAELRDG